MFRCIDLNSVFVEATETHRTVATPTGKPDTVPIILLHFL